MKLIYLIKAKINWLLLLLMFIDVYSLGPDDSVLKVLLVRLRGFD